MSSNLSKTTKFYYKSTPTKIFGLRNHANLIFFFQYLRGQERSEQQDHMDFIVQWCYIVPKVSYHICLIPPAICLFLGKQEKNQKKWIFVLLSTKAYFLYY